MKTPSLLKATPNHDLIAVTFRPFCALLLVVCASPLRASADVLPADALRMERDGKFDESRALLTKIKNADAEAHLALLAEVERVEAIQTDYVERGMYVEAQRVLEAMLPKLDVARDVYLILRLQRGVDDLRRRTGGDEIARALLDRADGLLARGAHARAKEVYSTVAMSNAADIGQATLARARRGMAKAERAALDAAPASFLGEILVPMPGMAKTLSQWIVWGGAAWLALLVVSHVRRRALIRKGNIIELVDLTASGEARGPANYELNQALNAAIQRMIGVSIGRGSATLEAYAGVEGASKSSEEGGLIPPERLAFVDPQLEGPELAKFNEIIQVAPAVQLGPIGVTPRQFWDFLQWLVTRTFRYTVTGTLFQSDGQLVLHVSQIDRLRNKAVNKWRAVAPSTGGRATCVIDIAAQVVLCKEDGATVTTNCESLRSYVSGLDALIAAADVPQSLETSRALLQRSLTLDPSNWLARFDLGVVLRKIGDTASAARQLRTLDDAIRIAVAADADPGQFKSLRAYCEKRPDFRHIVRYHLASALAQSGDADSVREAGDLFRALITVSEGPDAEKLRAAGRLLHLGMLGRSGDMALLLSRLQEKPAPSIGEGINACMEWFEAHEEELERVSPADHAVARGIVLHAFGRFQYLNGNFRRAVRALKEATLLVPRFADPYVNLAQVYLKWKDKVARDWPLQVKAALDRALAIEPTHAKARYVYAKFYYSDAVRDLPKAEQYLRDSLPHAGTLFLYGQVLEGQGKYAEALQALDRSFAMDADGPDFRVRLYGACALEMARGGGPPTAVDRHRQRFDAYRKKVRDPKETARLERLLRDLDAVVATRRAAAAHAPTAA